MSDSVDHGSFAQYRSTGCTVSVASKSSTGHQIKISNNVLDQILTQHIPRMISSLAHNIGRKRWQKEEVLAVMPHISNIVFRMMEKM